MGIVAGLADVPADRWPDVLSTLCAAGITVDDESVENGTRLYRCHRNKCNLCLETVDGSAAGQQRLMVYYPEWFHLRRPLGMWRLHRDVRSAVRSAGGRPISWSDR
jgi:hypothetical protein